MDDSARQPFSPPTDAPPEATSDTAPDPGPQDDDEPRATRGVVAVHGSALIALKLADALFEPKLVVAWILTAAGAPAAAIGAVAPVREAGSLLPQVLLAPRIGGSRRARPWWVAGARGQALAALALATAAATLEGTELGLAALAALAVHSVSRAFCSLSYKEALAKTVPKGRRGTITGTAGSVASIGALAFAGAVAAGIVPREVDVFAAVIAGAGALWMLAALLFSLLKEPARASEERAEAGRTGWRAFLAPLGEDAQLRRFLVVRALLTVTALAPPFVVMLSAAEDGPGNVGALLLAAAAASIVSGWLWGRLSDRSSRWTLMGGAALSAAALGGIAGLALEAGGLPGGALGAGLALFAAQLGYEGVRAGRKRHLTDMTDGDRRARYTALANTLIGAVVAAGGAFGALAAVAGPAWVLAVFAGMSLLAVPIAWGLAEVQREG